MTTLMPEGLLRALEARLGRPIAASEAHSLPDLNAVPLEVIEEARRLNASRFVEAFLTYLVDEPDIHQVRRFITDVVHGGRDPATWHRGGVLATGWPLADMLRRPAVELLAPLGPLDDLTWVRIVPSRAAFDGRSDVVGAPAVARPDLDYRFVSRPPVYRHLDAKFEPVADLLLASRRWVAARLARSLAVVALPTAEGLLDAVGFGIDAVAPDAALAAAGLAREMRELGPLGDDEVPGFRGPDSWYVGP